MAKIDLKSFKLEYATVWIAAVFLACGVFACFYAFTGYIARKQDPEFDKKTAAAIDAEMYEKTSDANSDHDEAALEEDEIAESTLPNDPSSDAQAHKKTGSDSNHESDKTQNKKSAPDNESDEKPQVAWSYAGITGPGSWFKLSPEFKSCAENGTQSPIDIRNAKISEDLDPIGIQYSTISATLINNGKYIEIRPNGRSTITAFDQKHRLESISIHSPAEHRIKGQKYDIELQFNHRNEFDELTVISILGAEGAKPNKTLAEFWPLIPTESNQQVDVSHIQVGNFLGKSIKAYTHYTGSLTKPPCSTPVRWVVVNKTFELSEQQMDALFKARGFSARPLQPIGERNIVASP